MKRWVLVALAALAGLAVLAVPSSGGGAGDRVVAVNLSEFELEVDRTEVSAGRVRFDTSNEGRLEHELLIVRTDLAPDALPLGLDGPSLALAGEVVLGTPHGHGTHQASAGSHHVQPGQSRRDALILIPGRYVLLCNLPRHYEAGQSAHLLVR